jgi:hypothetical protein
MKYHVQRIRIFHNQPFSERLTLMDVQMTASTEPPTLYYSLYDVHKPNMLKLTEIHCDLNVCTEHPRMAPAFRKAVQNHVIKLVGVRRWVPFLIDKV